MAELAIRHQVPWGQEQAHSSALRELQKVPPTCAAPHLVQQTVPNPRFLPAVLVRVWRTIVATGSLQGSYLHIHIQEL